MQTGNGGDARSSGDGIQILQSKGSEGERVGEEVEADGDEEGSRETIWAVGKEGGYLMAVMDI